MFNTQRAAAVQTAPVFKQASIRPGSQAAPAHLVLGSACWQLEVSRAAGARADRQTDARARERGGSGTSEKEQILPGLAGRRVQGGGEERERHVVARDRCKAHSYLIRLEVPSPHRSASTCAVPEEGWAPGEQQDPPQHTHTPLVLCKPQPAPDARFALGRPWCGFCQGRR